MRSINRPPGTLVLGSQTRIGPSSLKFRSSGASSQSGACGRSTNTTRCRLRRTWRCCAVWSVPLGQAICHGDVTFRGQACQFTCFKLPFQKSHQRAVGYSRHLRLRKQCRSWICFSAFRRCWTWCHFILGGTTLHDPAIVCATQFRK